MHNFLLDYHTIIEGKIKNYGVIILVTAEVALYPLKTSHASSIIDKSINSLQGSKINYSVNSINTHITGTKEEVFKCLERMFSEAEDNGNEISMVLTITNASY